MGFQPRLCFLQHLQLKMREFICWLLLRAPCGSLLLCRDKFSRKCEVLPRNKGVTSNQPECRGELGLVCSFFFHIAKVAVWWLWTSTKGTCFQEDMKYPLQKLICFKLSSLFFIPGCSILWKSPCHKCKNTLKTKRCVRKLVIEATQPPTACTIKESWY